MNKYKITYENGKTEITRSEMSEERMKEHLLPSNGSHVVNEGRIVVGVELVG